VKRGQALLLIGLALVGVIIYGMFDPAQVTWFPRCPFLSLTGYRCPGCGSQRAIHALLHGDLATAWHYNAALVTSIPFIIALIVAEILRTRRPRLYALLNSRPIIILVFTLLLAWWLLRNLLSW